MIHPAHLRRLIQETLGRMGSPYDSPAAVELLMLTAVYKRGLTPGQAVAEQLL